MQLRTKKILTYNLLRPHCKLVNFVFKKKYELRDVIAPMSELPLVTLGQWKDFLRYNDFRVWEGAGA